MDLAPQDIYAFIEAWANACGEYLPRERAEAEAKRLFSFFIRLAEESHERADPALSEDERIPV